QWPVEAYAHLIDLLLTSADINVALIGTVEDRQPSEKLLTRDDGLEGIKGRLFDLIGKLNPTELPSLLARASLYVGRDGRFRHLVGTQASL
ncbi:glycosyltransferase family 9 protein, partial [Acinetobacter baumannii]